MARIRQARTKTDLPDHVLRRMGEILIEEFVQEAKKDFVKRGWQTRDPETGRRLEDTFTIKIVRGALEVRSFFFGLDALVKGDIPPHKMWWMTQEYKEQHPEKFPLTEGERKRGMTQGGRISRGTRLPLVVPIDDGGSVVLRTAPWDTSDAWVHPGVKKFTFPRRAVEKARVRWEKLWLEELLKQLKVDQGVKP